MIRITLILIAAFLGACATYHDTSSQRLPALPQHYSQFDVQMGWETRPIGEHTVVDGVVKNVRYAYMYDLEVWVAVLDSKGKELARSVSFIIPQQLYLNQTAPFSVKLPVSAPSGTRLRFTYEYLGSDGGDNHLGGGGARWVQSFQAVVP